MFTATIRRFEMIRAPRSVVVTLVVVFALGISTGRAQQVELVSVNFAGTNSGNFISGRVAANTWSPGISEDGRIVVFESRATDILDMTDANGDAIDIFARDMLIDVTLLVSQNLAGTATGAMGSSHPVISPDGRWIAFQSGANDLVSEDTSGAVNIFLHDLVGHTTRLVSIASSGTAGGNGNSSNPIISRNGSWVVFESEATNLSTLSDTNNEPDLFAFNRHTGEVTLITANYQGTAAASGNSGFFQPVLSEQVGGATRLAFASTFTNLVIGDTNGTQDVFARFLPSGQNTLISGVGASGWAQQPMISADGGWIAFTSDTPDLVANDNNAGGDCFLNDGSGIILISRNAAGDGSADMSSMCTAVNADRGFVVFTSYATDLVANDTNNDMDVFIREVRPGITSLVSTNASGTDSANSGSIGRWFQAISRNGRFIVFESFATDLEGINTDGAVDVYVRDHCLGTTYLIDPNLAATGSGNNESDNARLSLDGRWVTFSSRATNLDSNDNNGWIDTYRSEVPNWGDWHCGALNEIFRDGFESGTTTEWSTSVP
jgi:Tol biopolymer transport system component